MATTRIAMRGFHRWLGLTNPDGHWRVVFDKGDDICDCGTR